MTLTWIIILAIVYFIGLVTVQWLDETLDLKRSKYHYWILTIMWILTPIIIIAFIIKVAVSFISRTIK